jgi:uncharacterized protein (DUF362 family)
MGLTRRRFLYLIALAGAIIGLVTSWKGLKLLFKGTEKTVDVPRKMPTYRRNGKSLVSMVGGRDIKEMVREAVGLLGGFGEIDVKEKNVLVKPNVVSGRPNPATTDPEVVRAVVELLYEAGASRVYVGDLSAIMRLPTRENMEKSGIRQAAEGAGAETVFFEDHGWIKINTPRGKYLKNVKVSEWIFTVDRVINLPVIKTHRSAGYSICLKNFVGATHPRQRPYLVDAGHWEEVVAETNLAYTPELNILDGTTVMVAGGPWSGEEARTDLIVASGDRVAADVVGLGIIKSFGRWQDVVARGVWEQRQIKRAVELGMGASHDEEMELLSVSLNENPDFLDLVERVKSYIGSRA